MLVLRIFILELFVMKKNKKKGIETSRFTSVICKIRDKFLTKLWVFDVDFVGIKCTNIQAIVSGVVIKFSERFGKYFGTFANFE